MPIFEFHCQKCDKTFERLVFRTDEVVECPDCGEQGVCSATSCSSCG
jgi:putative FmdB family regulatory protein